MRTFTTIEGDLLSADYGFIIHGCNNQGVMGSGVAAGVKTRYPGAYVAYKQAEATLGLGLGTCSFYQHAPQLFIVNAITQTLGTPNPLDIKALGRCFWNTLMFMNTYELAVGLKPGSLPLLFPLIGAGRAGGNWNDISDVIGEVSDALQQALGTTRSLTLYTVKQEPADCR